MDAEKWQYIQRRNIEAFDDTYAYCKLNQILSASVVDSQRTQRIFLEGEELFLEKISKNKQCRVVVSKKSVLEAAQNYVDKGYATCLLSFASATNPGGGTLKGALGQEESLCRCSTLYPCLTTQEIVSKFYEIHKVTKTNENNDDCIYTSNVCVFKNDKNLVKLKQEDWWNVNIITCAAPDLRNIKQEKISYEKLLKIFESRIKRIFEIAMFNRNNALILGAFGCGAYKNPPEIVSKAFKNVIIEYGNFFDVIEFAIYQVNKSSKNYEIFSKQLLN